MAFRGKGVLSFHHWQNVSMSVGKRDFSKTARRIFLKLLMKLGCLKGKKLTEPDFWEKNFISWIMPKNTPQNRVFWILQKKKKKNPLMCRFFRFKSCSIMTYMILLLKPHVWEESGSRVKCKTAFSQSYYRIFKLYYLKNYWKYKADFLYAGTYQLKLQIDDVILDKWVQAYPGMPKEAIKFLRTLRRYKVDFVHILCIFCDI